MQFLDVSVVIPVKNRPEILTVIHSLLKISNISLKVIVCDGGSTDKETLKNLNFISEQGYAHVLKQELTTFNKSTLLNMGIAQAKTDIILCSDADILWNRKTFFQMINSIKDEKDLCYVRHVEESEYEAESLSSPRYSFIVEDMDSHVIVRIVEDSLNSQYRPGPGLVCASRCLWENLGGFKEMFEGWGWEDQDLLIRGKILGSSISNTGTVVHLTHPKNFSDWDTSREISRNKNILKCLSELEKNKLRGNLYSQKEHTYIEFTKPIICQLPPSIQTI
ncbi:MAG: glycosyltransferase [Saprospiraceae bacterium]|nr:glycosyltransferase [Saprospiraceae bacterium]